MDMKKILIVFILTLICSEGFAQQKDTALADNYKVVTDIPYTSKTDTYAKERLKLDVYYPTDLKDCPVVVWFHGGGLTGGSKQFPWKLEGKKMVLVGVNYRLLPKVTVDKTLDDCAEAVYWVMKNIAKYNGSTKKVFVSGHSAGGYITMMLALDKEWLANYNVDANDIAGYVPFSGQAISHFSYRKMQGIPNLQPTVDKYAPLYWVRKDCPPMILITGDREAELFGRYEENAYLWRMMKLVGNNTTELYEIGGHGHGAMMDPGYHILENSIYKILGLPYNP